MKIEGKIVDIDHPQSEGAEENNEDEEPVEGFGEIGGFQSFIQRFFITNYAN
jgi:hypothetical protein